MKINLEFLLKFLPLRGIIIMILDYFKARAKDTETKLDDIIEEIIRLIVENIDFDTFKFDAKFLSCDKDSGLELIKRMMETLKIYVEETEYKIDDIIYSILKYILRQVNLLK